MYPIVTCVLCASLQIINGLLLDDATSSLQAEVINLRARLAALESTINDLTTNINSECNLQCPRELSVAFMATLSTDIANPAQGHVVVFDDVITNVGNAYNVQHGIFTAPVNGTYNFNLIASSPPVNAVSDGMQITIQKNSVLAGYTFLYGHTSSWSRRTTDITLHLAAKDEIWVEIDGQHGSHTLAGAHLHTHLSGFLVRAD